MLFISQAGETKLHYPDDVPYGSKSLFAFFASGMGFPFFHPLQKK
jgi:hypothetical protein